MLPGFERRLYLLPIITVVLLLGTFLVTYFMAVNNNHVYPVWPYISDTGTLPPESCYFGQFVNTASLLVGIILYSRNMQIRMQLIALNKNTKPVRYLNYLCFLLGMIMMSGISMVGNFQETSNLQIHILGANFAFVVGSCFFIIHTFLCFVVNNGDKFGFKLNIFRVIICILLIVTFTMMIVFTKISMADIKGGVREAMKVGPSYPLYKERLIATFSEWAMVMCLGIYILTFSIDFKNLRFDVTFIDRRYIREKDEEEPHTSRTNGVI